MAESFKVVGIAWSTPAVGRFGLRFDGRVSRDTYIMPLDRQLFTVHVGWKEDRFVQR